MSITRSHNLMFGLLTALLAAILLTLVGLIYTQQQVAESEHRRFESYRLANELHNSSNDLTRFARLFVQTGDERFAQYFQEVLGIRHGLKPRPKGYDLVYWDFVLATGDHASEFGAAISLQDRMIAQGFSAQEFRQLNHAQQLSDELANLEAEAFELVRQVVDTKPMDLSYHSLPNIIRARTLLSGKQYLDSKSAIMQPINEFLVLLNQRTVEEHQSARATSFWILAAGIMLAGAALLAAGVFTVLSRSKIIRPLSNLADSARRISAGDYETTFAHQAKDEVGEVANAFNVMVKSASDTMNDLRGANTQLVQQQGLLAQEKKKSDDLLCNILPIAIAERIKAGETQIADEFPEVSVMFADLVGFTKLAETLGPHKVVNVLNDIFEVFDQHLEEFKLEKIKTMGDCYMVVAGLPEPMAEHAQNMANFALQIQKHFKTGLQFPDLKIQLRIGIHAGTAVAGVVGTKKIAYDLWGDVVNVASRMESTGQAGEVHVSESFMVRLRDSYNFRPNGVIDIKGKGDMQTYFLIGPRYENAGAIIHQ